MEHCCSIGRAIPVRAMDLEICRQHVMCFLPLAILPCPHKQFNIHFIQWTPLVQIPYTSNCCLIRIWLCMEDIFRKGRVTLTSVWWLYCKLATSVLTSSFIPWSCELSEWSPPPEKWILDCVLRTPRPRLPKLGERTSDGVDDFYFRWVS